MMGLDQGAKPVDLSIEWFTEQLSMIWQPLLLGSLTCGVTIGVTGFFAVRLYYRWRIARYIQRKRQRKPGEITRI
jgi:uncharacterized protein (DUF2062 family)